MNFGKTLTQQSKQHGCSVMVCTEKQLYKLSQPKGKVIGVRGLTIDWTNMMDGRGEGMRQRYEWDKGKEE
jgi:hypothetical protein